MRDSALGVILAAGLIMSFIFPWSLGEFVAKVHKSYVAEMNKP